MPDSARERVEVDRRRPVRAGEGAQVLGGLLEVGMGVVYLQTVPAGPAAVILFNGMKEQRHQSISAPPHGAAPGPNVPANRRTHRRVRRGSQPLREWLIWTHNAHLLGASQLGPERRFSVRRLSGRRHLP